MHVQHTARGAFNPAREAPNFVYLACFFFLKTSSLCVKTYNIFPLNISKKKFGPPSELSCAPLL
jgi:hypothetical protein